MSEQPLKCPMCGGAQLAHEFKSTNGYDVVRCAACRLVFVDARTAPPPNELYPAFEQSDTAAQRSARQALSLFTLQRAKVVEAAKPSGRLLDYGAGAGQFARFMAGRGFESVGLEPYSLGTTVEEPNLRLVRAPLAEAKKSLGTFDVITMWHVLEHVMNPVEVLAELEREVTAPLAGIELVQGGFETCGSLGPASVVRAMNVLRGSRSMPVSRKRVGLERPDSGVWVAERANRCSQRRTLPLLPDLT